MGVPQARWMVFRNGEIPWKWMMTGVTPMTWETLNWILVKSHYFDDSHDSLEKIHWTSTNQFVFGSTRLGHEKPKYMLGRYFWDQMGGQENIHNWEHPFWTAGYWLSNSLFTFRSKMINKMGRAIDSKPRSFLPLLLKGINYLSKSGVPSPTNAWFRRRF